MMHLSEAALASGGVARNGDPLFVGVSNDSRHIEAGALFIALRGPTHDGHAFIDDVIEQGAAAAMVDTAWPGAEGCTLPLVVVPDTRLALGSLAGHWRTRFDLPLVGVTGSNGKTTAKEMLAACLRAHAGAGGADPEQAVLATRGNLNNDIGLPLMLLRLTATHRAAVVEMGMNHPGEIAYLAEIARPTVALVTNAQRAHLAGLGGVAEVAREKGALYEALGADGVAVINADDPHRDLWLEMAGNRRVLTFGLGGDADVGAEVRPHGLETAVDLRTPAGNASFTLQVPGLHNVRNALGAAAAALAAGAGLDAIAAGLGAYRGFPGRLQRRALPGGATLIDDSYNANPDSVRAAIDVLAALPGRRILVLGDMGEAGDRAGEFHDEAGGYAKSQGVDLLFGLGTLTELAVRNFGSGGRHFTRLSDLVRALRPHLDPDTVVLVKGSRFMRMERIVEALAQEEI